MKTIIIIKALALLLFLIMFCCYLYKVIRQNRYGKVLLKIGSVTYKKGLKGKKCYQLKVAPVSEGNKIYLPIAEIAQALGYKIVNENESGICIFNYCFKKIIINDDDKIVVIIKGLYDKGYKLREVNKRLDNELMVSINTISDIFDINYEIFENGEIILK